MDFSAFTRAESTCDPRDQLPSSFSRASSIGDPRDQPPSSFSSRVSSIGDPRDQLPSSFSRASSIGDPRDQSPSSFSSRANSIGDRDTNPRDSQKDHHLGQPQPSAASSRTNSSGEPSPSPSSYLAPFSRAISTLLLITEDEKMYLGMFRAVTIAVDSSVMLLPYSISSGALEIHADLLPSRPNLIKCVTHNQYTNNNPLI